MMAWKTVVRNRGRSGRRQRRQYENKRRSGHQRRIVCKGGCSNFCCRGNNGRKGQKKGIDKDEEEKKRKKVMTVSMTVTGLATATTIEDLDVEGEMEEGRPKRDELN
ncbi:hypothetical protein HN873_008142 [Arachis hypogaea]